jgi:ribonuclease Z
MRLMSIGLCLLIFSNVGIAMSAPVIKVTLLGTGTPFPNAERFGSAILVEVGGEKLLFDCGRGAAIRLTQAGVALDSVDELFLTHLHSDHTVGIPDLWLTGWFLGRDHPLRVWGPPGTREMTEHLSRAYQFDVQTREHTENLPPKGVEVDAEEIEQGDIYIRGLLRVSAFLVDDGPAKPAFGYRIDYSGHAVVISGDTKFSQNLVDFSKGADCLIHMRIGYVIAPPALFHSSQGRNGLPTHKLPCSSRQPSQISSPRDTRRDTSGACGAYMDCGVGCFSIP